MFWSRPFPFSNRHDENTVPEYSTSSSIHAVNITDNSSPGFNYAILFGSDRQQNLKCQYGDNFTVLP